MQLFKGLQKEIAILQFFVKIYFKTQIKKGKIILILIILKIKQIKQIKWNLKRNNSKHMNKIECCYAYLIKNISYLFIK